MFAYAELHPKATRMVVRDFLCSLTKAVPYTIHTVLTDKASSSPSGKELKPIGRSRLTASAYYSS